MANSTFGWARQTFYLLATLILITALLYWGKEVLVPLALAIMLAFILSVPAAWMEHRGLPRFVSVPVVSLLAFSILGAFITLATHEFRGLTKELPQYEETIRAKLAPLRPFFMEAKNVQETPKRVAEGVEGKDENTQQQDEKQKKRDEKQEKRDEEKQYRTAMSDNRSTILGWISRVVGPALGFVVDAVLVIVLTIFILARRENVRDRLVRLIGRRHVARTTKAMDEAADRVSHYLLLQTLTNTVFGTGVGIGLWLIGLPYPALWGLLTGAMRFVPYVGIWIMAVAPIGLSIAIFPGWLEPVLVVSIYLGLELVIANVIEPLLFGHGTGITPVGLLVAVVFWGALWGPVGLLLAIPMTVCLVVIGKHAPPLRFLDVLLEEAPALDPASRFYQRLIAGNEALALQVLTDYLKDKPAESVYDEVLIPALVQIRQDRRHHQLSLDDETEILQRFRFLLEKVAAPDLPAAAAETARVEVTNGSVAAPPRRVIACPADGAIDEVAATMLLQLLKQSGVTVEIMTYRRLLRVPAPEQDEVVCVISLPPGGLTYTATVCRRLRARLESARILVGRWSKKVDLPAAERRLEDAGADAVATTLLDTRKQILSPAPPATQPAPQEPSVAHH